MSDVPEDQQAGALFPPLPPVPLTRPLAGDESDESDESDEPGDADARQDTPDQPDTPAGAPRVERGGLSALLDVDTNQMPVTRMPHRVPLPAPILPDTETMRLSPAHHVTEADTTQLPPAHHVTDAETVRLPHKLSALEIETTRLRPRAPALETETTRLRPRNPASTPETETEKTAELPRGQAALDAETARLARGQAASDAETARLARKNAAGQGPDYTLQRAAPMYIPHGQPSSPSQMVADEDALQEEANAALALFTSKPSVPDEALPNPVTPSLPNKPWDTDDETQAVIQALRVDMYAPTPLRDRARALVSQPPVAIMALFALAQMALLAFFWRARPLSDETSALTQGGLVARNTGLPATYSAVSHFIGALLWPAVTSAGYLVGGLTGVRVIAIVCTALAGLATANAAKNLFGPEAGIFTALTFAISGPVIYFAHLAVPDQLALVGVAVSFWAITKATAARQREWLVVAACACAVAVIAQFSALLCLIPLLGVALALRARPAATGFFMTGLIVVAIIVSRVFPAPESALALLPGRSRAGLSLSVSVSAAGLQLLAIGALAWVMVIAGWIAARERGRLAVTLVAGMLVWPVALALAGSAADAERHIVFGLLFGLPLVGAAFATLWDAERRLGALRRGVAVALLLAVGTVGLIQARALDTGGAGSAPHGIHVVWGKADAGHPGPALTAVAADK